MMNIRRYCILLLTLTLGACIRNDIPYPVVSIDILSVQGEGFTCESSDIDTKTGSSPYTWTRRPTSAGFRSAK